MTDERARRPRVPGLAPQDRRAALIEATLPLLRQYGAHVSTRQIADAAGVAEGTIFGVFPDKASLIRATAIRAIDPEETVQAIGGIDRALNLRQRLELATGILIERMTGDVSLLAGLLPWGVFHSPVSRGAPVAAGPGCGPPPEVVEARERVINAVVSLIGSDAARLRRSPGVTVNLLISIAGVAGPGGFGSMPTISTPAEIVSLLLDGLLRSPDTVGDGHTQGRHGGGTTC